MLRISHYQYSYLLTAILVLIHTTPLMAASFNCQMASTEVEKMICNNPQLSEADERMSKAYFNLYEALPKPEAEVLKEDQRHWLEKRNYELLHCVKPYCKDHFYEVRIQQLHPVEQAGFNCRKAGTQVEKKICDSRLLRHADGRMVNLYQLRQMELKQDQREWLTRRDMELGQSYCDINCAWQFYKDRIEFLTLYLF